ncbi:MAG: ISLre2 family transposase, partial [Syntrophomonadaceae bacterium]|nr:ISLre2 family transposase [Syntrophomonadaceae bacterium]
MNRIILHACQKFITEVVDFFREGKAVSLAEIEKELKESSDKFLRDMIKSYLEETDRQIAEDKAS